VRFFRYAADSVNLNDARPSSFAEIKVGDQLRALGQKSEDGSRLAAEEIRRFTRKNADQNKKHVTDLMTRAQICVPLGLLPQDRQI
jgi:Golgi nucleoside diphosphatase